LIKFIKYIALLVVLSLCALFYFISKIDGSVDPFYTKITSPKQSNLIIGTSKAAQGIQPDVLHKTLKNSFFNYSFTLNSSPYGEVYLNSIKNKLNTTLKKDNIFILTVDVWSLSSLTDNPNNSKKFREANSFLHTITNVSQKPNFKYLLNYFNGNYYTVFLNNTSAFLHENGWLEVSLSEDKNSVERRSNHTIKLYEDKINIYKLSDIRIQYFMETIKYLNNYGDVYIVRLPVDPKLYAIENQILPNLELTIANGIEISKGYLDLSTMNSDFTYTDGVHLNPKSGKIVTKKISDWILESKEKLNLNN